MSSPEGVEPLDFVGVDFGFVGPDAEVEGVVGGGGLVGEGLGVAEGFAYEGEGGGGGFLEVADDFLEEILWCVVWGVGSPGVVVGGEGDEGVGDFGFAGEFGFGHDGHADQVPPPHAVEVGFGAG